MVGYQRAKDKATPMWQTSKKRRRAPSSHVLNFTSNLCDPSDHHRELKHEEGTYRIGSMIIVRASIPRKSIRKEPARQ